MFKNQKGAIHLLFLLAIIGVVAFLLIAGSTSFKNKLFSGLFPKPDSNAAEDSCSQEIPIALTEKPDLNVAQDTAASLSDVSEQIKKSGKNLDKNAAKGLASKRKKLLIQAMRNNPNLALNTIAEEAGQKNLASVDQNCIEQPATIEGNLEAIHADFFKDNLSTTNYVVKTSENKYIQIHPVGKSTATLISGKKVKVKGYKLDNDLIFDANVSDNIQILSNQSFFDYIKDAKAASVDSLGAQQTLVVLAKFQDTQAPTFTIPQLNDLVFNKVSAYYKEISYDKTSFNGKVIGPITLPINSTCTFETVKSEVVKQVDPTEDFKNYPRLLVFIPFINCGFTGMANLGKVQVDTADGQVLMSTAFINTTSAINTGSTNPGIISHELGHNLGVDHADYFNCGSQSVANYNCYAKEYLDRFDVMGNINSNGHMNAPHKDYLGFFSPSNILTVNGTGSFTIENIETKSDNLKALKIPIKDTGKFLYVEYRQPLGQDLSLADIPNTDVFSGALLHIFPYPTTEQTMLLDGSPDTKESSADSGKQVSLKVGQSIIEPETGKVIKVLSRDSLGIKVEISQGTPQPEIIPTHPLLDISGVCNNNYQGGDPLGKHVSFNINGVIASMNRKGVWIVYREEKSGSDMLVSSDSVGLFGINLNYYLEGSYTNFSTGQRFFIQGDGTLYSINAYDAPYNNGHPDFSNLFFKQTFSKVCDFSTPSPTPSPSPSPSPTPLPPVVINCNANTSMPVNNGGSVTWTTATSGGASPLTYNWQNFTDYSNFTTTSSSVTKSYTNGGFKYAKVSVTDALNRTSALFTCKRQDNTLSSVFVRYPFQRVFISNSNIYNGNLGGLTGAKNICQSLADNAAVPLGGIWDAWLSASGSNAVNRLIPPNTSLPYKLINGSLMANNWAAFLNSQNTSFQNAILIDQNGKAVSANQRVITGTAGNGVWDSAAGGGDCSSGTNPYSSISGKIRYGQDHQLNQNFTSSGTANCGDSYYLYCVEK